MPKISVIVPVYRVEPYLHRCVDSILAQTFSDFELILVDDGSPDNCPAICDEYAKKDNRVVVIHQENGGLSAARNAGIDWAFANSNSEWITFIDSDDWIHPEMIERLYLAAIDNKVSVSVCSYVETDGEEPTISTKELHDELLSPEDFFVTHRVNAIIACGKLYKKECFEEIRYPVGKIHEDEFTTYKILFEIKTISYINAPLYFYFVNPDGITKSEWNVKKLDGIEAQRKQLAYFINKNFLKAAQKLVVCYILNIVDNIDKLHENVQYLKYKKALKKELKRTFNKYHTLIPFKENIWIYECAYPNKVRLYWLYKGVIHKIKSIFGVRDAND